MNILDAVIFTLKDNSTDINDAKELKEMVSANLDSAVKNDNFFQIKPSVIEGIVNESKNISVETYATIVSGLLNKLKLNEKDSTKTVENKPKLVTNEIKDILNVYGDPLYISHMITMIETGRKSPICSHLGKVFKNIVNNKDLYSAKLIVPFMDLSVSYNVYSLDCDCKDDCLLHNAIYRNDLKMVKLLLKNGMDINKKRSVSCTPLMYAVELNRIEIAQYLFDHKAYFNKKSDSFHILNLAIKNRNTEMIKLLIKNGIDINGIDSNYHTHLLDLYNKNDMEMFQFLKENGAKKFNLGEKYKEYHNTLCQAISKNDLKGVQYFMEGKDLIYEKNCGYEDILYGSYYKKSAYVSPFELAVKKYKFNVVQYMVEELGADVNSKEFPQYEPPLYLAAQNCDLQMVRYFVNECNASVTEHIINNMCYDTKSYYYENRDEILNILNK